MTKNIPLLLFVINISACLYQSYVQLYTKLIYMSFLQDDHLISIGLMITIVSSAIFGLFWGHLADKKGPPFAIICFIFIDLIFKIYSSIARSRAGFIIAMILLGSTDKTMLILFGPTLIDCYGLAVATQMLPFKGVSGIVTIILASILGYVFAEFSP
jgi:MFS family permease